MCNFTPTNLATAADEPPVYPGYTVERVPGVEPYLTDLSPGEFVVSGGEGKPYHYRCTPVGVERRPSPERLQVGPIFLTADSTGYAVSLFAEDVAGDVPAGERPLRYAARLAAKTLRDYADELERVTDHG
jgi:hypothetical protein